jgi:hypothetical protein
LDLNTIQKQCQKSIESSKINVCEYLPPEALKALLYYVRDSKLM